jgi:Rrf2 family transcriptional regulator, iron-sulfur cluster assembly transcription factor
MCRGPSLAAATATPLLRSGVQPVLSLTALYAIRAGFDLAYHGEGGVAGVRDVAQRQEIPPAYAEQVLRRLRQAGLVAVRRGRRGGYSLARPAGEVSLLSLVQAVGADPFRLPAGVVDEELCAGEVRSALEQAAEAFARRTLAELCEQAQRRGLPRGRAGAQPMFYI